MQNTLPKRLVSRWAVVVIGVVMTSLGSAAPAHTRGERSVGTNDLSAEDRCAIAKLQATWLEAKCMADARISGITQNLTNEELDARLAACKDRTDETFESAEGDAVSSTCTTIGDVINYALSLATHIPTACRTSEQPCDFRAEEDPAALSATTLRNRTPNAITGSVGFMRAGIFCRMDGAQYLVSGPIPGRIEAGQTGRADAAACLIQGVQAFMHMEDGALIRCTEYGSSGTAYRTFQVVLRGDRGCLVNRP
jgi:hypothetical protein